MSVRRVLPLVVLVVALAIIGLLPITIPETDDTIVPGVAPAGISPATSAASGTAAPASTAGESISGTIIQQQFPAEGANLDTIALLAASQGMGTVTVQQAINGKWEDFVTQTIAPADWKEGQWYSLQFSPPLAVKRGQPLQIVLRASDGSDRGIAVGKNSAWQPDGYRLAVNAQPQTGTLRFTAHYAPRTGRLIGMLGALWGRVTVFLNPFWRIGLLIGAVLLIVGAGAVARFLIR
jgi:hypothetical protein